MRRKKNQLKGRRRSGISRRVGNIMNCLCSGGQLRADKMVPSSEPFAANDSLPSGRSSRAADAELKQDNGNIEEAESSLRESGCLNYEEARALLGRYEYQKGNIEAALHVFEGINIAAVAPKMKLTLAKKGERHRRRSQSDAAPLMSIHAVSLLLEAIFLKAKSLQGLGRFKEAAQSCNTILDIVESSLPEGLHMNFGSDCKLQETLNKATELLPELWKLADSPHEAILSYRRALLHPWHLDMETVSKIQKEFAVFLLYSGGEASPPELRSQMDGSFVPRNNIEEAILLLILLLRKICLEEIEWDPSILDHLSYALALSGGLRALANLVEELLPGIMNRQERYYTLALCYYGDGDSLTALDLLKKLLSKRENPKHLPALLTASKICGENPNFAEEGVSFARRALESFQGECAEMKGVANYLLGISLSAFSRSVVADSDRVQRQAEALHALETAGRMMKVKDPNVVYHLSLESAEQRKLDVALYYANYCIKLEGGSSVRGWLLLARILSAQKRFKDAETVINAAIDQTGKWDQGQLLRTRAKLQIARGRLKQAIQTYTRLLAVLQVLRKSFGSGMKFLKGCGHPERSLELDTWHDLAYVYISLSKWHDAELCLAKSRAINPYSATRYHAMGLIYQKQKLHKEALKAFANALDISPTHVPSLISMAVLLRQLGTTQADPVVRSLLMQALSLDRTNPSAWYNLGLVYKDNGAASSEEAAECFETAALLEESTPVEPFR